MPKRYHAGRGDKNLFKRTAAKSKDINLGYTTFRGGIRF